MLAWLQFHGQGVGDGVRVWVCDRDVLRLEALLVQEILCRVKVAASLQAGIGGQAGTVGQGESEGLARGNAVVGRT